MNQALRTDPDDNPGGEPWPDAPQCCPSCGDAYTLPTAVCQACAESGACTVCAGPHRAWQCPHVALALRGPGPDFGDPPPRPTPPPPPESIWDGQKIAKAFHTQYNRFVATLLTLDVVTRAKWAVAYVEYMNARHTLRTPLTAAQVFRVWDKAAGRDIHLPPRCAA